MLKRVVMLVERKCPETLKSSVYATLIGVVVILSYAAATLVLLLLLAGLQSAGIYV